MFSLLNPLSLWLGSLIAVPLLIHFLGRQKLDKRPFPSLLLVRERLARSMQRHRLKNLLLLLIRTLLILCLLLALAKPALERDAGASAAGAGGRPDASLALIHNGIYGALQPFPDGNPSGGNRARNGSPALEIQRRRILSMDSAEGSRTVLVPVIADGPGALEISERFGDYGEAMGRLLSALEAGPGTAHIHVPVFAWQDLAPSRTVLLRALEENPGARILFSDFGVAAAKLNAFSGLRARPSANAPTVELQARMHPAAMASSGGKVRATLNGRLFQEAAAAGGIAEITLPLGEKSGAIGSLSVPGGGFAVSDLHFSFPGAGSFLMAHSGTSLASLPSLGRETYFRRIIHVPSAIHIPWEGAASARTDPSADPGRSGRGGQGELRLVYLSGERGATAEAYGRAVEFVRQGGRLIIGAGRDSDIPLMNRFLLQPLRMGRLGGPVESAGGGAVAGDRRALAKVVRLPGDPGSFGSVRKRFAFSPDSGVEILLSQGGPAHPVLAMREFQRGQVLFWTTDLDDLDWSDLGLAPMTPLLHQAFQEAGARERAANAAVDSDSIHTAHLDSRSGPTGGGIPAGAEVRDPEGRPFTKVRSDGTRLRIGPFDRLGIHRVISGTDTMAFAVNLRSAGASEDPLEWESANKAAKAEFLKGFEAYRSRFQVLPASEPPSSPAAARSLWPALFLAAILLLLLEGLISATFSLRNRP